jgi:uncharacterized protein (TIGR02679 family)
MERLEPDERPRFAVNNESGDTVTALETLLTLERKGLGNILRIALERFKRDGTMGRVSLKLEAVDFEALKRLTGQNSSQLDLSVLDAALRSSIYEISLEEVLTTLNAAPIVIKREVKNQFETDYAALITTVTNLEWQDLLSFKSSSSNVLRRALKDDADSAQTALEFVQIALEQPTSRKPVLASRVTGNAHGFDKNQLAGRLLDAAVHDLNLEPPMRDGVSSSVLIANLRGTAWLDALEHRAVWCPWREVQRLETVKSVSGRVMIVENPSVFEALLEAQTVETLLCTSGQLSAANMTLLKRFDQSTKFWVSCDFDLGGLRIAARIQRHFPDSFRAWRFAAPDFLMALERSKGFPLEAKLELFTPLFPDLVAAMLETGYGAHHEAILPELLQDVFVNQ